MPLIAVRLRKSILSEQHLQSSCWPADVQWFFGSETIVEVRKSTAKLKSVKVLRTQRKIRNAFLVSRNKLRVYCNDCKYEEKPVMHTTVCAIDRGCTRASLLTSVGPFFSGNGKSVPFFPVFPFLTGRNGNGTPL